MSEVSGTQLTRTAIPEMIGVLAMTGVNEMHASPHLLRHRQRVFLYLLCSKMPEFCLARRALAAVARDVARRSYFSPRQPDVYRFAAPSR